MNEGQLSFAGGLAFLFFRLDSVYERKSVMGPRPLPPFLPGLLLPSVIC